MSWKSFLKQVGCRQNSKPELLFLRIDESAIVNGSNAGVLEGKNYVTVTKNGTGDYTITFNRTCRRVPVVVGAVAVGLVDARCAITSISESAVRIVWEVSGTDTNADFHLTLGQFFSQWER